MTKRQSFILIKQIPIPLCLAPGAYDRVTWASLAFGKESSPSLHKLSWADSSLSLRFLSMNSPCFWNLLEYELQLNIHLHSTELKMLHGYYTQVYFFFFPRWLFLERNPFSVIPNLVLYWQVNFYLHKSKPSMDRGYAPNFM